MPPQSYSDQLRSMADEARANIGLTQPPRPMSGPFENQDIMAGQALVDYANNPSLGNTWRGPISTGLDRINEELTKAQGGGRGPDWQMAAIGNPKDPAAKFAATAFPKMYQHLEQQPETWNIIVGSRRSAQKFGVPDLYKEGSAGYTIPPEAGRPGTVAVREDVFNKGILGGNTRYPESTLGHELQHAVQYTKPGTSGLPGKGPRGGPQRLMETASQKYSDLPKFAAQYEAAGGSPGMAAREGLTEAAGRTATAQSKRLGLWSKARQEVHDMVRDLAR